MTIDLEKKKLYYLLTLAKSQPNELFYLLDLHCSLTVSKCDEVVISRKYFSIKNGVFSLLDLENEPIHMDAQYADMELVD